MTEWTDEPIWWSEDGCRVEIEFDDGEVCVGFINMEVEEYPDDTIMYPVLVDGEGATHIAGQMHVRRWRMAEEKT